MDASEDGVLLSVAASICEGAPVDWHGVTAEPREPDALRILREMALVEVIANFHRDEQEAATPAPLAPTDHPTTWGRFTNLECVGQGSFGAVYRARDTKLETDVALKLLWPAAPGRSLNVTRALKEARMLARVRHPNVVRVFDTEYIDGRVGIWMEFIKGSPLAALLRAQGPFGANEARLVGFDLCRALAAVHAAGLVHGDLKTQNVMREEGGRTVLMDFGAGKHADAPVEGSDFAGTPLYIAPEVFSGAPRTHVSDIYSLGVLLYHLVTNAYPITGATRDDIEERHAARDRRYLLDVRPDLPPDFVRAVEKAMAPDPKDRFQSAGAFEAALAEAGGTTVLTRPLPPPRVNWTSRRTLGWIGVVALAAASVFYSQVRRTPAAPPNDQAKSSAVDTVTPGVDKIPAVQTASSAGVDRPYDIDAAFYRVKSAGSDRLLEGSRVTEGDQLFARVRVSTPAYVYIVNEDDRGAGFLLFPRAGEALTNPLTPQTTHRIPAVAANRDEINWEVSSTGGREHFLVFASPERLAPLEDIFARMPQPTFGRRDDPPRLPPETATRLRGVGGLASSPHSRDSHGLALMFTKPLLDHAEATQGMWARQLTVKNPGR